MGQLLYPTDEKLGGPWLLDEKALEDFDGIVDSEWERLTLLRESEVNTEAERRVGERREHFGGWTSDEEQAYREEVRKELREPSQYPHRRTLEIKFKSGRTLVTNSFADAKRDAATHGEVAIGFSFRMKSGERTGEVELPYYGNDLRVSASPQGSSPSLELFLALREWAIRYRAPRWQRLWRSQLYWLWMLFGVLLLTTTIALAGGSPKFAKEEARRLLSGGLQTTEEKERALELTLSLLADYQPEGTGEPGMPGWYLLLNGAAFISCFILSFRPSVTLGIGRGCARLKWWRWWMRIVGVVVPGLLFSSFVVPQIVDGIRRLLGK